MGGTAVCTLVLYWVCALDRTFWTFHGTLRDDSLFCHTLIKLLSLLVSSILFLVISSFNTNPTESISRNSPTILFPSKLHPDTFIGFREREGAWERQTEKHRCESNIYWLPPVCVSTFLCTGWRSNELNLPSLLYFILFILFFFLHGLALFTTFLQAVLWELFLELPNFTLGNRDITHQKKKKQKNLNKTKPNNTMQQPSSNMYADN